MFITECSKRHTHMYIHLVALTTASVYICIYIFFLVDVSIVTMLIQCSNP